MSESLPRLCLVKTNSWDRAWAAVCKAAACKARLALMLIWLKPYLNVDYLGHIRARFVHGSDLGTLVHFLLRHCAVLWCIGGVIAVASPLTTSTKLKTQEGFSFIFQAHRSAVFFFFFFHSLQRNCPLYTPLFLSLPAFLSSLMSTSGSAI